MYDLFIVGGGINGCGIARDAAGRGLSVALAEMGDLGSGTSSASTKLFHGGLRYLEYFEFRLVREALIEREVLLQAMPHISWPMRFVLPLHRDMRFDRGTPTSRLLGTVMPWMRGRRPDWLIRLGLFLYDHLGGRRILPGTARVDLTSGPEGAPLDDRFVRAFEYSDCWVDDARLVVLNASDARDRGADILVRTTVTRARRDGDHWAITLQGPDGAERVVQARMLVNAAGPWAGDILSQTVQSAGRDRVRLVRGSHIVTRRLYNHDKAYFFQGADGRIIFAIPYEQDFTLIGTTEQDHDDPSRKPVCTDEERRYLLDFANRYFKTPVQDADIVWTYSGVRPLFDAAAQSATAASRDYTLKLETAQGAPLLSVFGGKITTYRRLAESAMKRIAPRFPGMGGPWTAGAALPGGNFAVDGVAALIAGLRADYPFLTDAWAGRLVRAYGTRAREVLGNAADAGDLGEDFGATLTAREVAWLMDTEFAQRAEDVVWRRSKLGLRLDPASIARLDAWMLERATRA